MVESTSVVDTRLHPHECLERPDSVIHNFDHDDQFEHSAASDDDDCIARAAYDTIEHSLASDDDERTQRRNDQRALRHDDKFDREVARARAKRERLERRPRRNAQHGPASRRHPTRGPRFMVDHDERPRPRGPRVRRRQSERRDAVLHQSSPELPTGDHVDSSRGAALVATYSNSIKRFANGPLHGTGLALYFVLLPYVVLSKWRLAGEQTHGTLVRALLICLALFWLAFLGQLGRNVMRLRHGAGISTSGSAWLAGMIVALLSFLMPGFLHTTPVSGQVRSSLSSRASGVTTTSWREQRPIVPEPPTTRTSSTHQPSAPPAHRGGAPSVLNALPLALVAKRRHDQLRQHQFECPDDDVEELIDALRALDPHLIARLRFLIGPERSGVIHISGALETGELSLDVDPLVGCLLTSGEEAVLAFSREGGTLSVNPDWSERDIEDSIVALHDGRLVFVRSESELLRALATRALHNVTVIYLGEALDLDDELRASCITLTTMIPSERADIGAVLPPRDFDISAKEVRVELLRASPVVTGLSEPFASTLRRRCIEMVAYLALHRDEPITGERLRSRVLGYADIEASSRTLANTASAVRRSLGHDAKGPLLHPVSSSGLYETHGVTSDVAIFHELIVRARTLAVPEASMLAHEALQLVQGEPLASALRGFEWFLAEGHLAQLQRDGEYAALLVHHQATSQGDFELAFWSLQQGLRIDPFSDVLIETIARVPRLRQFGRDRPSRSQDESVGAGGTVVVGWSFNRLGDQIT